MNAGRAEARQLRPPRTRPLAIVWRASGPRRARDVAASAAMLVVERVGTVAFALEIVRRERDAALLASGALALLYAARAVVRGVQRSRVQERLHLATARALLGGDVLRASPLDDEDAQGAVLDGAAAGSRFMSDVVPDLFADALVCITMLLWLGAVEPHQVLGVTAVAVVTGALLLAVVRRAVRRAEDRAWRLHGPVVDDLLAMLTSRLELVANGREIAFLARVTRTLDAWRRASLRADALSMIVARLPALAAVGALAAVLGLGISWQDLLGRNVVLETAVVVAGFPSFVGLARGLHEAVRVDTRTRAMAELLVETRGEHGRSGTTPVGAPSRVDLEALAFAYAAGAPLALAPVSVAWARGTPLVICGPNGAGKSTLLRLLLGLASPTGGAVRVDGRDLRGLDGAAWRRGVAYLAQRPYLSDRATVREAIQLLAPGASDDAMRAVLEKVDVWAALLASGRAPLDARIGALSVGQRQRVALARVLVMDAPILVLDEPDANLDSSGIARVKAIVEELSPGRMIAVVAHTDALVGIPGTLVRLPQASSAPAAAVSAPASVLRDDARA